MGTIFPLDTLLSALPGCVLGASLLGCLCLLPFLREDTLGWRRAGRAEGDIDAP
jgi:hypothetical protein